MYRPSISSPAQDETTAASGIFRIVLYDFAFLNDFPNIRGGNHSIRPGHLAHRMRQKEYPLRCSISYQLPEFHVVVVPWVCVIFYVELEVDDLNVALQDSIILYNYTVVGRKWF